jgi:UDPglucose 6-dehydrogenase/GDP-mannose 6-dehydrogenase
VVRTSNAGAEFIKYTSNSLLATLISFSNEIADLCETLPGVDAAEVFRGVHLMRELTPRGGDGPAPAGINGFIFPGCGFGGSCLPKDVKALSAWGAARGRPTPLLDAVLGVNADRPRRTVEMVERALGGLQGKRVAVLGLAFKPETDDVRESPAFPVIRLLRDGGASVRAHDPVAGRAATQVLREGEARVCATLDEALEGADAVVLITKWDQYRGLAARLSAMKVPPVLVDGRRMIARDQYPRYRGIGLGEA